MDDQPRVMLSEIKYRSLAQENERLRKALRDIKTWCEADGGQDLTWIKQAIDYALNQAKVNS